jgi:FMN phosphatase YigB (HAD superfamily)
LSNTNEVHIGYLLKKYSRIFEYFEQKVFSFEVGAMKPDPRIYRHTIALSGRQPGSLFFIDDREENVLAARDLGMRAHQFISEKDLVSALIEQGVSVL